MLACHSIDSLPSWQPGWVAGWLPDQLAGWLAFSSQMLSWVAPDQSPLNVRPSNQIPIPISRKAFDF